MRRLEIGKAYFLKDGQTQGGVDLAGSIVVILDDHHNKEADGRFCPKPGQVLKVRLICPANGYVGEMSVPESHFNLKRWVSQRDVDRTILKAEVALSNEMDRKLAQMRAFTI